MNRARLLVIERDCSLRMMIERQLKRLERLDVEIAEEASDGVDRASLGQFDLVLASLSMPEMPPEHLIESLASVRPQPVLLAIAQQQHYKKLKKTAKERIFTRLSPPITRPVLTDAVLGALRHHQEKLCCSFLPKSSGSRARGSEVLAGRGKTGSRPLRLGHYEVTELIGGGSKGIVYRGVDKRDDSQVALRAIPREMVERLGRGTRWHERFTREATSVATVKHPHLSAVVDHGLEEYQRCLFVVNEYASGSTLAEALKEKPLEPAATFKMAFQAVRALKAVHDGGFAHRLIRPSNIHIDQAGDTTITDLGVASIIAWDLMPLRPRLDTTPYLSTEQIRQGPVDDRSDQFSLGLVLHEALTGRYCVEGESPSAKVHKLMSIRVRVKLDDGVGEREQITEILEKMLAPNPDERYQGDDELLDVIKSCAQDLDVEL